MQVAYYIKDPIAVTKQDNNLMKRFFPGPGFGQLKNRDQRFF